MTDTCPGEACPHWNGDCNCIVLNFRQPSGAERIVNERQRQIYIEGWTPEHDAEHFEQELARAAACYAKPHAYRGAGGGNSIAAPLDWPWEAHWWKPTPGDRIRELVKAGALIAAEIDRLSAAEPGADRA
jgi:hypothetical protein